LMLDSFQVIEKMERETGFEPATSSLGSWHSRNDAAAVPPDTERRRQSRGTAIATNLKNPLEKRN
jgi:hypothetical protein